MFVEVHPREDTKSKRHQGESLECNYHFFKAANDLGVSPIYVHLDKDYAEISAAQVMSDLFLILNLQSHLIWIVAIISLCSWHAKRAVGKYLNENRQSPWANKHPPLNYIDPDRERRWDADFLNSEWVKRLNEESENAFRTRVIARNPDIKTAREMEEKLLEMGKKSQICVAEKENRNRIVDVFMCHLKWHPLTHLCISADEAKQVDKNEVWHDQVDEMHALCEGLGEPWAWEYLWKSWYLFIKLSLMLGIVHQSG
jgi:hypothetical protein